MAWKCSVMESASASRYQYLCSVPDLPPSIAEDQLAVCLAGKFQSLLVLGIAQLFSTLSILEKRFCKAGPKALKGVTPT